MQPSLFLQELCSPIILLLSPRLCPVLLMQPLPAYSCITARDDSHATEGTDGSGSAPKSEPVIPSQSNAGGKGHLRVCSPTSPGAEPSPAPSQGRRGFVQLNPTKSHGWRTPHLAGQLEREFFLMPNLNFQAPLRVVVPCYITWYHWEGFGSIRFATAPQLAVGCC